MPPTSGPRDSEIRAQSTPRNAPETPWKARSLPGLVGGVRDRRARPRRRTIRRCRLAAPRAGATSGSPVVASSAVFLALFVLLVLFLPSSAVFLALFVLLVLFLPFPFLFLFRFPLFVL